VSQPQVRSSRTTRESSPTARRSDVGRRVGFVIGAVVNAVLLWWVNVSPGWQVVPFLTGDTRQVLGLVNASLVVGLVSSLVSAVLLHFRLRALGDLVQNAVGFAAMVRTWQVFPFDLGGAGFDWDLVVRCALVLGMVGSVIGALVAVVRLVRGR
jgi:hypothetical protein